MEDSRALAVGTLSAALIWRVKWAADQLTVDLPISNWMESAAAQKDEAIVLHSQIHTYKHKEINRQTDG